MEEALNQLVAKMQELDADAEEMEEEQLNSELQRELCVAVLCERMDKRNYRWEHQTNYLYQPVYRRCLGWDYKPNTSRYRKIRYDPKLADDFILSGKEQFRAFMKFCKSVKTLRICSDRTVFYFDKDVCMTESDPVYEHFKTMFKLDECFFIKTLLKHVKCLEVFRGNIQGLESLFPHLCEMQNLKGLVIYDDYDAVNVLFKLLKIKQMKTIGARLEVFQRLVKFVKNYKLEKMFIIDICQPKDLFKLSNFSPTELHLTRCSLDAWEVVSENKAFADTKKLFVDTRYNFTYEYDATLFTQVKRMLSTVEAFIDSVHKQFPKLEELMFTISLVNLRSVDLNHEENKMKTLADLCADFWKKYQGKLDVNLKFIRREIFDDWSGLHKYMKKQFPDQEYEVEKTGGYISFFWNNRFTLAKNVFLDYDFIVREWH